MSGIIVRVLFVIIIYLIALFLKKNDAARNFNIYPNNSLMFPTGPNVKQLTLMVPTLESCQMFCGQSPKCCCTQWVPCNRTCIILVADVVGLSSNPISVSSIDRMIRHDFLFCTNFNTEHFFIHK